jgi:hypothetical protein
MGGKKQALKLEYDKKMNLCIALIIYHTKKKKLIQVTCDIKTTSASFSEIYCKNQRLSKASEALYSMFIGN